MKNIFWLPVLLLVCGFIIGCGKDDNCDKKISAVQPNTNPAGYEVLIKTNGFTNAAKVVFGSVAATSRAGGAAGDIIAKVPAGLSGNVEISVEEGDCIARSGGFVVSGVLPSGTQPSLPNIIVPTPTTVPLEGIENDWANAIDTILRDQGLHLATESDLILGINQLVRSLEFKDNIRTNTVTGTINTTTNIIYLEVNRTPNGGSIEHFDGQFIVRPDFLATASGRNYSILLVSRETGRQLLLYFPKS